MAAMRSIAIVSMACVVPLAQATTFETPLGTQVPVNELTEVQFAWSLKFNTTLQYLLEDPSGARTTCTLSAELLSCPVTLTAVGDAPVKLYEAEPGSASLTKLDQFTLRAYTQPAVANVAPLSVPLPGGAKIELTFASALGPGLDGLKARFVHRKTGSYKDTKVSFKDKTYLKVTGRSPTFLDVAATAGDVLDVLVALNGRSFKATGLTATLVAKDKVKIGFLYPSAPDDFGWTFQHNLARLELEKRFFGQVETISQNWIEEWGPNECDFCHEEPGWNASKKMGMWNDEPNDLFGTHRSAMVIKKWVEEEDVKLIVAASFYYHWDTYHMAVKYPNVAFVHVGGWLTRTNMAQIFPKIYQARYLSGIAMGWYIKKHNLPKKVGFLSAFSLGETVRAVNALKLGLEMVDPEIDIYLTWMLTWHDDRKEDLGARRLIRYYGAEGIAQHTDSLIPQLAARDEGKFGTGYNTDMLLTFGDTVLTSPIMNWAGEYEKIVQQVLDGDVNVETTLWNGFDQGAVRLSDLSPLVPSEAKLQIAEEQAKLERGEDTIFCKPNMYDNRGRPRNGPTNPSVNPVPWEIDHLKPGTTCLTDQVVNQVCQEYKGFDCVEHWLLAGVHDTCDPTPRMPNGIQSPLLQKGECFLGYMDLPDKCPKGEYLKVVGCTKARPGNYVRDEKEYPCELGYYAPTEGLEHCLPCPAGQIANVTGAIECMGCTPGTYANTAALSECAPCAKGLFTDAYNATQCDFCQEATYSSSEGLGKCTSCPTAMTTRNIASSNHSACVCSLGTYSKGGQWNCVSCPASSSTDAIGSTSEADCLCETGTYLPIGGGVCLPCPDTMVCPKGSSEANYALYIGQADGDVTKEYPRLKARFWSSMNKPMSVFECDSERVCAGGDPGPDGCVGGLEGQACEHCPKGRLWNGKECRECLEVESSSIICLILPLVICPIFILFFYKMFGDKYTSWGTWRNGIASLAFIIINNYQIVNMMGDLNIVFAPSQISFFGFWSFTSDVMTVFRPQCGGMSDFKSSMTVKILGPAVLILIFTLTWAASQAVSKSFNQPALAMEKNRLLNVFFSLILTFFGGISAMAFSLFKCSPNPNNIKTLLADRAVNCYEEDWNGMLGFGVVGIVVWCMGFGLLFAWAIFVSPKRFSNPDFQMRWKFLFIKYRPDVHWWSIVFVIKGILLNFGFLIMKTGIGQIFWVITILMAYICLAITWTPWRHLWVNVLDIWAHLCLWLVTSTMIWFASASMLPQERADLDQDVASLTMASTFFLLPCIFPVLGYMVYQQQSGAARKRMSAMAVEVRKVCLHVAERDADAFVEFMLSLADRDFYYLAQAKHVLAQEMLLVRSRSGYSERTLSTNSTLPEATASAGTAEVSGGTFFLVGM